jgi:hypothetical protein
VTRLVPDAEVASVLIALAPLDARLSPARERLLTRREFDVDAVLDHGWSSGERILIELAGCLWRGHGDVDLAYVACELGGPFFQAAMDAIAARGQRNIRTDVESAYEGAL